MLGRQTLPGGFEGSQTELRVNLLAVSSLLEYPPVFPEYSRQLHRAQNKLCSSPIYSQLNFSSSCILWEVRTQPGLSLFGIFTLTLNKEVVKGAGTEYKVQGGLLCIRVHNAFNACISRYRVLGRLCDVHWRLFTVCWIPAQAHPLSMYRLWCMVAPGALNTCISSSR